MEIEICKLVFRQNSDGNSWWEAHQKISGQERVVFRDKYYLDRYWKKANSIFGVLAQIAGTMTGSFDEELNYSQEQKRTANLNIVAQMSKYGWEPMMSDNEGFITALKRAVSKQSSD